MFYIIYIEIIFKEHALYKKYNDMEVWGVTWLKLFPREAFRILSASILMLMRLSPIVLYMLNEML